MITADSEDAAAADSTVTITAAGTYIVSGTLSDGQIIVDAGEDDIVRIVLAGALSELEIYKTSFSKYGTEHKHYCANESLDAPAFLSGEERAYRPQMCANY